MKFYGTPNMLIRIKNLKPYKFIRFDANGEYDTENPRLVARLKKRFECEEPIEEKKADVVYNCRKCDFTTDNRGYLLAHYRESHPKEG